jgi:excinuclease ABC subunit C
MKELLKRRLKRLDKISPPNLWIIDGGETLLNLAYELSFEYQLDIDIIAIAKEKRDDRVNRSKGSTADIIYTKSKTFQLPPTDKRLQWVQKIRDEAHRFALSYHKDKKIRASMDHSFLRNRGIGVATIKRLLDYFGTFEAIKSASFEEISVVSSKKVAKILKTENVEK